MRINALSEVEADILVLYLTAPHWKTFFLRSVLFVGRSKSKSPIQQCVLQVHSSGMRKTTPEKPTFDVPLVAIEVVFQDQNGEVRDLEYTISCRGTLNFVEAYNMTRGGLDTSRMSLTRHKQEGVAGTNANQMDAIMGSNIDNFPTSFAKGQLKPDSTITFCTNGSKNRGTVTLRSIFPL